MVSHLAAGQPISGRRAQAKDVGNMAALTPPEPSSLLCCLVLGDDVGGDPAPLRHGDPLGGRPFAIRHPPVSFVEGEPRDAVVAVMLVGGEHVLELLGNPDRCDPERVRRQPASRQQRHPVVLLRQS